MGNCLRTQLKAVINNPNLPYLETMQQFTLDAIAESGNEGMTDAQKLALNHFFYQIGAIGNSGVYSKLNVISLPFIGGTKEGALTNYKKNGPSKYSVSNTVAFADGGFTGSLDYSTICSYSVSLTNNMFLFVAGTNPLLNISCVKGGNNATEGLNIDNSGKCVLSINPYTTYNKIVSASMSGFVPKGVSVNLDTNGAKVVAFDSTSVLDISDYATTHLEEFQDTSSTIQPVANVINNTPYAYAIGPNVTDDEQMVFMSAMKALMDAFS